MKLPRKTVGSGMEGGQTASGLIQLGRDHIPAADRLFHFRSGFFREILLRQQIPAAAASLAADCASARARRRCPALRRTWSAVEMSKAEGAKRRTSRRIACSLVVREVYRASEMADLALASA